jgi:hypothetical protein
MSHVTEGEFRSFVEELYRMQPVLGSPQGFDESSSSSESDSEDSPRPTPQLRRVVSSFDDQLGMFAMPNQTSFGAIAPSSATSQEDSEGFQTPFEESKQTTTKFALSEAALQATSKLHDAETPPISEAYPPNEFQDTSRPSPNSEPRAAQVRGFPDVLSFSTPEQEVEPHKLDISRPITEKNWTLKRTYLESHALDSLVTSIDLADEAPSKRRHHDFSDKSYGALFGMVADSTTGRMTTEQQVFPKAHWPGWIGKSGIHDHVLTSMTHGNVHIVSISMQTAFNISTQAGEIFCTVLSSASKKVVEVRINGQSNLISPLDSFKIPCFSQTTVINLSTRARARLQLVALTK